MTCSQCFPVSRQHRRGNTFWLEKLFLTFLFCNIILPLSFSSPRYRKVAGSKDSIIEHRHSMSICETSSLMNYSSSQCSSGSSTDQSSSEACSKLSSSSLSPDQLRRNSSASDAQSMSSKAANHLSCPDLEQMLAKAAAASSTLSGGTSGGHYSVSPLCLPNRCVLRRRKRTFCGCLLTNLFHSHIFPRAIETSDGVNSSPPPSKPRPSLVIPPMHLQQHSWAAESSQTESEENSCSSVSPLLHRRQRKAGGIGGPGHRSEKASLAVLPKFSISMEEHPNLEIRGVTVYNAR